MEHKISYCYCCYPMLHPQPLVCCDRERQSRWHIEHKHWLLLFRGSERCARGDRLVLYRATQKQAQKCQKAVQSSHMRMGWGGSRRGQIDT